MGRRRKTTEEFVAEARKVHGDRYGYDNTVYIGALRKVTITCHLHGIFEQRPNGHLRGQGCPKCGGAEHSDTESFVKRAVDVHGAKYSYDRVVYTSAHKKVTITCSDHGDFEQKVTNHLRGRGCPKCKAVKIGDFHRSDTESFVKASIEVHGKKYAYDKVVYTTSREKVMINCPLHGDFEQEPRKHLAGNGCPRCIKNWSGDGVVYVMFTPEGHNKIGIAKSGTEYQRLKKIFMSAQQRSPSSFTDLQLVCAYSFNDGSFTEASQFERKAHRHFKARRKQFTDKFDGSGEFFTVPVSEICSYLDQQGGKLVTIKGAP